MGKLKPNPGSDGALAQGCTCPVMDNGHGRGAAQGRQPNGDPVFWHDGACPLHGIAASLADGSLGDAGK